jgi:hypothetical protein
VEDTIACPVHWVWPSYSWSFTTIGFTAHLLSSFSSKNGPLIVEDIIILEAAVALMFSVEEFIEKEFLGFV